MAKRISKKTSKKKRPPSKQQDGALPAPHFIEQALQGIFGHSLDSTYAAQEHAYGAMEAMADGDWERAQQEATRAIEIDPNCIDALHILSQLGSESEEELIDNLRLAVERGERSLGKKFFRENSGYFWGLLETRPYMRARAELAGLLNEMGNIDEAIAHYEGMLQLNPNDNQGLRYSLLGCYLEQGHVGGAQRIFAEYPEEESAMFAWAKVLADVLAGEELDAIESLSRARKANKHVEAYLTGRKKLPAEGPGYYSPGEPSEAIVCVNEIGTAWNTHPEAVNWLKNQKRKR